MLPWSKLAHHFNQTCQWINHSSTHSFFIGWISPNRIGIMVFGHGYIGSPKIPLRIRNELGHIIDIVRHFHNFHVRILSIKMRFNQMTIFFHRANVEMHRALVADQFQTHVIRKAAFDIFFQGAETFFHPSKTHKEGLHGLGTFFNIFRWNYFQHQPTSRSPKSFLDMIHPKHFKQKIQKWWQDKKPRITKNLPCHFRG